MEPFARLDAAAVPIGVPNIDTDQIIPARFLWRKRHDGWGHLLFHDLRFNDAGAPKPEFVLNRDAYRDARIVVADRNFGCGSSREHAVWALYDYGIRAVMAPSFGDIFFNNSFQNGLLPVVLPAERVAALRAILEQSPGSHVADRSRSANGDRTGRRGRQVRNRPVPEGVSYWPARTIFRSRSATASGLRPSRMPMKPRFVGCDASVGRAR